MNENIVCSASASDPSIFVIKLNNPEKLNALNPNMLRALLATLDELDANKTCRAIILTGEGRGFCAGADLSFVGSGSSDGEESGTVQRRMTAMKVLWTKILPRMRSMRPVIIAAVNGPAAGGGLVLSLGADIRYAAPEATFHDAFIKIGASGCELGLSWILPRLIGAAAAWEMMLTGRIVNAEEAKSIGLVFDVVDQEELLDTAIAKAVEIKQNTPFGVWMTREVMWSSLECPSLQAAIDLETRTQMLALETADQREQLQAFMEKRDPEYGNR